MKIFRLILPVLLISLFTLASCRMPQPPELTGPIDKTLTNQTAPAQGNTGITSPEQRMSGAIFTTTEDGSIVNENVRYEAKEDVYLDGGPGPQAPAKAAGLPEGDYYFQVTDPSGKDLLSTDHISARKVHVNAYGVIDIVYEGTDYMYKNGQSSGWIAVPFQHAQGIDIDHPELGALTVQLFPYDDTPNPGGVYKVWLTPVDKYDPIFVFDPQGDKHQNVNNEGYAAGNFHGFIPAWSKTDNYKVRRKGPKIEPPEITVRKFHDRNMNGVWDTGEEEISGWLVDFVTPVDMGFDYTQFVTLAAEPGDYIFTEMIPSGVLQTVAILDGFVQSIIPSAQPQVTVTITADYSNKADQELHELIYGNVGTGYVNALKIYDRNGNGVADPDEPGIPGWKFSLSGTTLDGSAYGPVVLTADGSGQVSQSGLLPGVYTIEELIPGTGGWVPSGNTEYSFSIESSLIGSDLSGNSYNAVFTNYSESTADFGTKGYWHNKNGLSEIEADYISYVNTLIPYMAPSSYFGAGDEPFDGLWDADGDGSTDDLVAPSYNNEKVIEGLAAGEGTALAEISHFLTDANAGGDPREQLAQQLLAFLFNTAYRLGSPGTVVLLPDGNYVSAADLIAEAITAWESGTAAEQTEIKNLLDLLNNSDALVFIPYMPGPVIYP